MGGSADPSREGGGLPASQNPEKAAPCQPQLLTAPLRMGRLQREAGPWRGGRHGEAPQTAPHSLGSALHGQAPP